MAAIDEKKKQQPASKGVVTMTQKQLDAILETIGQLTTENAELQTKLYSGKACLYCSLRFCFCYPTA